MATTMTMASRSVVEIGETNHLVDGMQTMMLGHTTEDRTLLRPLPAEGMTLDVIHQASLLSSISSVSPSRRMPRTFYPMLFEIAHHLDVLESGGGGGGPNDPNDPFGSPGGRDGNYNNRSPPRPLPRFPGDGGGDGGGDDGDDFGGGDNPGEPHRAWSRYVQEMRINRDRKNLPKLE
eukprot:153103-Amphidinium_carterae.1